MTGTLVIVVVGAAATVGIGCAVAIFKACTTEFHDRIQDVVHRTWHYFWPIDDAHSSTPLPSRDEENQIHIDPDTGCIELGTGLAFSLNTVTGSMEVARHDSSRNSRIIILDPNGDVHIITALPTPPHSHDRPNDSQNGHTDEEAMSSQRLSTQSSKSSVVNDDEDNIPRPEPPLRDYSNREYFDAIPGSPLRSICAHTVSLASLDSLQFSEGSPRNNLISRESSRSPTLYEILAELINIAAPVEEEYDSFAGGSPFAGTSPGSWLGDSAL